MDMIELEKRAKDVLASRDLAVKQYVAEILAILIKRYGVGYDHLKTVCVLKEGLLTNLTELDEFNSHGYVDLNGG